jgi:hypothetical protein
MLDLKAVGKRPAATTGSSGSSPLHKRFHDARWYATHSLQIFDFSIPLFCTGFVIPACMLLGDELKLDAGVPGLRR